MTVLRSSAHLCVLAVAAFGGCSAPPLPARTTVAACQALGNSPATARSALGDSITLPESVDPRYGLAIAGTTIVAFDQDDGRVTAVDSAGEILWTYGRTGNGPGEIARPFSTRFAGTRGAQWVDADQGRIVVFDGRSILVLSGDGALVKSWSADAINAGQVVWGARRVRLRGEEVYLDVEGATARTRVPGEPASSRRAEIVASDWAGTRIVAALELPQLPVNPAGTISDGLAQAKPKWDLQQNCLVFSDGHSSRVVFVDIESGQSDTVDLGLPEWYIDVAMANEETRGLTRGAMPEPTARARVGELTLAGDGVLWMRPSAQSAKVSGGQIVWRYFIQTGILTQDTVAAFPRYVDPRGGVFAAATDSNGRTSLMRLRVPEDKLR